MPRQAYLPNIADSEVLNEVSQIVLKVGECPGSSGMRFKPQLSSLPLFDPPDGVTVRLISSIWCVRAVAVTADTFSNRFQAVRFSDFAAAHRENKSPTNSTFVTITSCVTTTKGQKRAGPVRPLPAVACSGENFSD